MQTSETIKEISSALITVQSEIKNVANTSSNPFFKSKYAPLDEVLNYVRPIITQHRLALIQTPVSISGSIGVSTRLIHSSGEWIEDTICVPLTESSKQSIAQTAGIIITYLRRYSITAIFGIAGEDDTDGNHSQKKPEEKPAPKKDITEEARNYISLVDTEEKYLRLVDWIEKHFTGTDQEKLLFELDEHKNTLKDVKHGN